MNEISKNIGIVNVEIYNSTYLHTFFDKHIFNEMMSKFTNLVNGLFSFFGGTEYHVETGEAI